MFRNIVHLSLRSFHSVEILKTINLKPAIQCRYGTKWSSRRPAAIVNEDELFDDTKPATESGTKRQRVYRTRKHKPKVPEKTRDKRSKRKADEPIYTALEADSKILSSLMLKTKTCKSRGQNSLMLLEGFRLIKDAMGANVIPKVVFFSRMSDILPLSLPDDVKLYKIPYRSIQLWSNLTTSPGILGICEIPDMKDVSPSIDAIPLTIICDNIREPGNLGTIIRAAAAVGCERLLVMKGCVDMWDPKVLRSAVGAHFRLPVLKNVTWEEIPSLIKEEANIFLADNNITYESEFEDQRAIQESCTDTSIESEDPIESEGSIGSEDPIENKDINEDDSHNNIDSQNEEIDQLLMKPRKSTAALRSIMKKVMSQLPVVPYYTLDFTKREAILVIGGETEGVSLKACKLLRDRYCTRVNVPLTNGVDSLNVGVAVGIITFEMRKQFMTRNIDDE